MNNNIINSLDDKINKLLIVLSDEYKDLLIENIIRNNNYTGIENITVRDIIDADNQIKKIMKEDNSQRTENLQKIEDLQRKEYSKRKRDNIYKLTIYVGIIYVLFGVGYYFFTNTHLTLNNQIPLIFSAVGIFVIILGFMMKDLKSIFLISAYAEEKTAIEKKERIELVEKWKEIEKDVYKITKYDYKGKNYAPLRNVLNKMNEDKLISSEEMNKIKIILNARNLIMHNRENEISDNELNIILRNADEIKEKLKNISEE